MQSNRIFKVPKHSFIQKINITFKATVICCSVFLKGYQKCLNITFRVLKLELISWFNFDVVGLGLTLHYFFSQKKQKKICVSMCIYIYLTALYPLLFNNIYIWYCSMPDIVQLIKRYFLEANLQNFLMTRHLFFFILNRIHSTSISCIHCPAQYKTIVLNGTLTPGEPGSIIKGRTFSS